MKHNKIKNTGIIFEILCRKITNETLNPDSKQPAIKLVKRFFKKQSNLLSELLLYRQLSVNSDINNISELVDLVAADRKKISNDALNSEKFQLIKEIKRNYDIKEFFESRVDNYRLFASIYNLFDANNSVSFLKSKERIVEEYNTIKSVIVENDELDSLPSDLKKMTFKIIVEKFNNKYRNLLPPQKILLSKFINDDITTKSFKTYIVTECSILQKKLNDRVKIEKNDVLKIKLNEISSLLNIIITDTSNPKEDHISSLLKYYELVEELK